MRTTRGFCAPHVFVSGQAANTYAPRASPDRSIPSQTLVPRALSISTSVNARNDGLGNALALLESQVLHTPNVVDMSR